MQVTFTQLNAGQVEVCNRYILNTDGFAFDLNAALRLSMIQNTPFEGPLAILDSVFDVIPAIENPSILFRGAVNDIDVDADNTFISHQFMSASTDEMVASRFTNTEPTIFLRIHLQCFDVKLLNLNSDTNNSYEEEYLIPRNTRFRVLYRGVVNDEFRLRNLGLGGFMDELSLMGICPIS